MLSCDCVVLIRGGHDAGTENETVCDYCEGNETWTDVILGVVD